MMPSRSTTDGGRATGKGIVMPAMLNLIDKMRDKSC